MNREQIDQYVRRWPICDASLFNKRKDEVLREWGTFMAKQWVLPVTLHEPNHAVKRDSFTGPLNCHEMCYGPICCVLGLGKRYTYPFGASEL